MKKANYLHFFLTAIISNSIFAQPTIFKPFKMDMGIDFSFPANDEFSSGMGVDIEGGFQ